MQAIQGDRDHYQPLNTRLCSAGDPYALTSALLALYPFSTIYIADLDALMGRASNWNLIQNLAAQFSNTTFWVDQGLSLPTKANGSDFDWTPVLGSESIDQAALETWHSLGAEPMILSLDFSFSGFLGPKALLESNEFWPERVIIMSLPSVGAKQGPDWERLTHLKQKWPRQNFIAAGGVRHEQDLQQLRGLGFRGVLVATALHQERISAPLIERLRRK